MLLIAPTQSSVYSKPNMTATQSSVYSKPNMTATQSSVHSEQSMTTTQSAQNSEPSIAATQSSQYSEPSIAATVLTVQWTKHSSNTVFTVQWTKQAFWTWLVEVIAIVASFLCAGKPMKLIYFVSPYDLLDKKTLSAHPMTVEGQCLWSLFVAVPGELYPLLLLFSWPCQ